jgi:NADPH-dependent curcumin reductase CurA
VSVSREWRLARRPSGWPVPADFELAAVELPELGPGQVRVANTVLSVDPYMRGRMNEARSYAEPYALGQPMYGGAVGRVAASRSDRVPEGALVRSMHGWREGFVAAAGEVELLDTAAAGSLPSERGGTDSVPDAYWLGVLGMPGLTAWVGLFDIAEVRPGETVFVSAAAGAVGSVVCQLARELGCRVIGSAGGAAKVGYLRDVLRVDAALDYRAGDLAGQLLAAAPGGVDVYFDNVGGDHLEAALTAMNPHGRVAACGMISSYNEAQPGPVNLALIVGKKLTIRGFIVSDHAARGPAFARHVGTLLATGRLSYEVTTVPGIEQMPAALLDVLRGGRHTGKLVIAIDV